MSKNQVSKLSTNFGDPVVSEIFNPFAGGRYLKAITHSKTLNRDETSVLLNIGSKMNFNDFYHASWWIPIKELAFETKMSERQVQRVIKSLKDNGYINVKEACEDNGSRLANVFSLTDKIFREAHEAYKEEHPEYQVNSPGGDSQSPGVNLGGDSQSPGGMTASHPQYLNTNPKNISSNDEIYIGTQSVPTQDDLKVDEKVSTQESAPKGRKRAAKGPKVERLRVTPTHKKMIAVFRPTDPIVKKTCFVMDNDIHFYTDHFLGKFGERGHAIIDQLFTDMMAEGKCGSIVWDIPRVNNILAIAERRLTEKDSKNE